MLGMVLIQDRIDTSATISTMDILADMCLCEQLYRVTKSIIDPLIFDGKSCGCQL